MMHWAWYGRSLPLPHKPRPGVTLYKVTIDLSYASLLGKPCSEWLA